MKALTYTGREQLEMRTMDAPDCGPGEVLLEVRAAGICGSDLGGYLGHHARRQPPLVLGHEVSGLIMEVGAGVEEFHPDQRACVNPLFSCGKCELCLEGHANLCPQWRLLGMDRVQGAMAEYVCVPSRAVHLLESDISDAQAACIEPLACAVHLLGLAPRKPFSSLFVVGGGTQGALVALLARKLGYYPILVADVNPLRLQAVSQFAVPDRLLNPGEEEIVDAVLEATNGLGAALTVDAVGATTTRAQAVSCLRPGGTALFLGLAQQSSELDIVSMVRKEQQIFGSFAYTPGDFTRAQSLIERREVDLSPWTEIAPLEEGPGAFHKLVTEPGATLKIVLRP